RMEGVEKVRGRGKGRPSMVGGEEQARRRVGRSAALPEYRLRGTDMTTICHGTFAAQRRLEQLALTTRDGCTPAKLVKSSGCAVTPANRRGSHRKLRRRAIGCTGDFC